MPTSFKWNSLAEMAHGDGHKLFMLAADDIIFTTPHWDKALLDHYHALENKVHVYSLRDSRDHDGTPHPIITREYVEAMGYFLPPIFLHWFVDSWTVEIARANNCFTPLNNYMLMHVKPAENGNPEDETYKTIHARGWLNCDQYVDKKCQHFLEVEKQRLRDILHMDETIVGQTMDM